MEPVRARETLDRCTLVTRRADGSVVWLSSSAQPIFEEGGRFVGYRGVDVDITELSLAKRELEQMALHDPMTGLANRRKFCARFDLERTRQSETRKSFALLLVDVDHFKRVNDQFGHLTGDACLRLVANQLSTALRVTDLVGRFGGEEFMVLLPDSTPDDALQGAETLRSKIESASFPLPDGGFLPLTISLGVARCDPEGGRDFEAILEEADRGVYAAKQAGRNCVRAGWLVPSASA